jgi:nucleotide-binding universal stress UspA family protein
MNTILVPLDGSPLAEQVLPYARVLATTLETNLHLLHVLADERSQEAAAATIWGAWGVGSAAGRVPQVPSQQPSRREVESYLEVLAQPLRDAGLRVTTEVAAGWPAETIVRRATEQEARLIAMGTHGYSGLRRWALGSVTDRVAHLATMPVFVVRAPADTFALTRILVPLDGSPEARAALPLACELAQRAGAAIDLLTVVRCCPQIGLASRRNCWVSLTTCASKSGKQRSRRWWWKGLWPTPSATRQSGTLPI